MEKRKVLCINLTSDYMWFVDVIFDGDPERFTIDPDTITLEFPGEKLFSELEDDQTYQNLRHELQNNLCHFFYTNSTKEYVIKLIEELKSLKKEEFYNSFKTIKFKADNINAALSFIKNNRSFLNGKTIILPGIYNFDLEKYSEYTNTLKTLKDLLPDSTFEVEVELHEITYPVQDYEKAIKIINDIVSFVKSLNLSPLEELTFVYDIVKARKYQHESKDEGSYKSRDLISALLGNAIVCSGFDAIIRAILNNLGFKTKLNHLIPNEIRDLTGHVRTCLYVDDPKYNVSGHYFIDVTCDSKTNDDDLDYLNNYDFFLRTLDEINKSNRKNNLRMTTDEFLSPDMLYDCLSDIYRQPEDFRFYLNNIGYNRVFASRDDVLDAYKYIYESFNNKIEPEKLLELIYNVRKVEYYLNPDATPFTIDDLKKCIKTNRFYIPETEETANLSEEFEQTRKEIVDKVFNEDKAAEIAAVKLTRILKNYQISVNK